MRHGFGIPCRAFAELAGGNLALNELAAMRADLLGHLFPGVVVTRHDAAHIHDHLDSGVRPTVALMNPPFSAAAHVDGRVADAALRHISSALARLVEGGRLVAITGASFSPDNPTWRDAFIRLQERGRVVFTAAIDGRVYARHGTTIDTRLTAIDRVPADDPTVFPDSTGMASDPATLLDWVTRLVPARPAVAVQSTGPIRSPVGSRTPSLRSAHLTVERNTPVAVVEPIGVELNYEVIDWTPAEAGRITEAHVAEDTPLRLNVAAALAYPDGSMTASGLRREAARGRLAIERTAGKDYTTLGAIRTMRDLCRREARGQDCGSGERAATEGPASRTAPCGSSETETIKRAQAAARMIVQELKGHSPNTSTGSTSSKRPKGPGSVSSPDSRRARAVRKSQGRLSVTTERDRGPDRQTVGVLRRQDAFRHQWRIVPDVRRAAID